MLNSQQLKANLNLIAKKYVHYLQLPQVEHTVYLQFIGQHKDNILKDNADTIKDYNVTNLQKDNISDILEINFGNYVITCQFDLKNICVAAYKFIS